jgi:2-polyprenyl-3-methyl-5-hydroxy-6-metoxy-1,4-benzoquinol methylase
MTILEDPQGFETQALFKLVDFNGKKVLEIGCGDGRLTWLYASQAAQVTGIDPNAERIARARQAQVNKVQGKLAFHQLDLEGYATQLPPGEKFDLVLLSWSL